MTNDSNIIITIEMVDIPKGTFLMGSSKDDGSSWYNERPQHLVNMPSFAIGRYPITQSQWETVTGNNPSHFKGADLPVDSVSWDEAIEFCASLTKLTGTTYLLPSEGQWEYASRAGTTNDRSGDLDAVAWYESNSGGQTHPVGQKQSNAFGLYDMQGNVWEWCEDVWHKTYDGAPPDGGAWVRERDLSLRVIRGGSWNNDSSFCRSANRLSSRAGDRFINYGLRVVRGGSWYDLSSNCRSANRLRFRAGDRGNIGGLRVVSATHSR